MDRTVDVATGEYVSFAYELAGLGSRFVAVFVDGAIQSTCALAGILALSAFGFSLFRWHWPGTKLSAAVLVAFAVAALFTIFFGYFIAFEALWNGRTPGKRLLGVRVVRDGGYPIDISSAVVRNVVRVLEVALGFYVISAVSALLSPLNRRLGDYAAGTLVVRERFGANGADALPAPERASNDPLVRDLGSRERDLVRRYAARRATLGVAARATVAAQISRAVRPRLPARFDHLSDDELLLHVAKALG